MLTVGSPGTPDLLLFHQDSHRPPHRALCPWPGVSAQTRGAGSHKGAGSPWPRPPPVPPPPQPTWKTSLAHLRHRLCWQGRITTGLENISRQMGQMSCFSRLSMLCASPSSGLKPTVKFIPSAILPALALALVLAFPYCLWTLPRLL